jgi:hypothetical protein
MPNLLPQKEKKSLENQYYSKLIILGFIGLVITALLSGILLFPSLLLSKAKLEAVNYELEVLKLSVGHQESRNIEQEINKINIYSRAANALIKSPVINDYLDEILSAQPQGLKIKTINYRKVSANGAELTLAGNSSTRERLVLFVEELKNNERFSKVELPISNLAKDRDVDFNLTIVMTF